jgi:hypothetical protein
MSSGASRLTLKRIFKHILVFDMLGKYISSLDWFVKYFCALYPLNKFRGFTALIYKMGPSNIARKRPHYEVYQEKSYVGVDLNASLPYIGE